MGLEVQPATAHATILPEVRANFIDAMEMANPYYNAIIDSLVNKVSMDTRLDKQAYWEMTGNPRRWDQGTSVPRVTMRQKMYLLNYHVFGAEMIWSVHDARDSKGASIAGEASKLAAKHMTLRPRMFAQILEGSANADLKDTVETSVDGTTLYASSKPFNTSSGNIEGISSVTSSLLAYENIWKFHTRFQGFSAPDGINPLLSPEEYEDMVIFVHPSKKQFWFEAAKQAMRPVVFGSDTAAASVDNLLSKGYSDGQTKIGNIEIVPFYYLTDADDVYAFARGGKAKAIVEVTRSGLEEYMFGPHNSLECARNMIETYQASEAFNMRAHFSQFTIKGNVT